MSFFITLIENSDISRRAIETLPKVHSMMHKGLTLPEYGAFLHDLYHIVLHFCPIMSVALEHCDERMDKVRDDLKERIAEEAGHEQWVLQDVVAIGGDTQRVIAIPPSAPVQAMIGFNYYACERVHPCAVLGMLYVLEVVASVYGGKAADSIARATGKDVATGGFRFLSSHATMDAQHLAQLNVLLKTIADPAAQAAILESTRVNFHQFGQLFSDGGFVTHVPQGARGLRPASH